jgi:hypothetical protein
MIMRSRINPTTCTKKVVALNLESFLSLNHFNNSESAPIHSTTYGSKLTISRGA